MAVCGSALQCVTVSFTQSEFSRRVMCLDDLQMHMLVLQCVAVCCSVLQCVAVCCSVWQCVAVCCCVIHAIRILALRDAS